MKTLFFDYNRREQFSKQITTLIFFLNLAKKFNFLLVIPRFRFLPTKRIYLKYLNENEYFYKNFSDYFNFKHLKKFYNNIIEINDIIDKNYIYPIIINTTDKSNQLFLINNNYIKGIFNGYNCKFKKKSNLKEFNIFDTIKFNKFDESFLFFDDVLEHIKYEDPIFNDIRNYLIYNQYYQNLTDMIINEIFPNEYLAIHWRRTDFLIARKNILGVIKNKEYLVNKCKKLLKQYNLNYIYLSTDSNNKEELEYIYNNLPIIDIKKEYLSNTDLIIIETLICIKSKIFYGTRTSLFSKNIISLRIINKNNLNFFL